MNILELKLGSPWPPNTHLRLYIQTEQQFNLVTLILRLGFQLFWTRRGGGVRGGVGTLVLTRVSAASVLPRLTEYHFTIHLLNTSSGNAANSVKLTKTSKKILPAPQALRLLSQKIFTCLLYRFRKGREVSCGRNVCMGKQLQCLGPRLMN